MSAFDNDYKLGEEIIFRQPSLDNEGMFILHKSVFIVDGVTVPKSGRCDNLMYNVELPTVFTPYHNEGIYVGEKAYYDDFFFDINNISQVTHIIDNAPHFAITFTRVCERVPDNTKPYAWNIQHGNYPAAMWFGGSLVELLKNMREWSFMLEEPFNSDHPMAIYSKMAFDTFETPQWVFDELDSLPDMHLAKFLKGNSDYKERLNDYPQMSQEMQDWFKTKLELFPKITTRQRLRDLVI
jgi:hypothetical protein